MSLAQLALFLSAHNWADAKIFSRYKTAQKLLEDSHELLYDTDKGD